VKSLTLERNLIRFRLIAACGVLVCAPSFGAVRFSAQVGERVQSGKLLVGFRAGVSPEAVLLHILPRAAHSPVVPAGNIHVVSVPASREAAISEALAADPRVAYVEPDRIRVSTALGPNDADYSQQWALQNIQALAAWGLMPGKFLTPATAGTGRIKVAVLDTGADCTHPDFMNGGSSADSASGGQILFASSRAYYPTTVSPSACAWQDDHGHGTHTAGIIGASANNTIGVAGAAYPVQLVIYKVLNQSGSGDDGTIAQGIIDAVNNGAAVISMSLGGAGYSQTFQGAINYAWSKNVLVVAAAGNSGSSALFYPAGANHAIGVGATDNSDTWATFSNYGNQIAVGAPGVGIMSTVPTYPTTDGLQNYGSLSGTSMAAPFVAALGGMVFTASPGITAAAARMRVEASADNTNAGGASGQYLGYGRINFARAISGNLRTSTQGGIVGQVVDAFSQMPVGSATISVAGQTIVTDFTGLYRLNGVPAGSWPVTISQTNYPTLNMTINVTAGADTECLAVLGGSPARFTGTVTDNGVPVPGAVVEAVMNGMITSSAVSDTNGSYNLYVQAGTYTITASSMYHLTSTTGPLSVSTNGTATANLTLPAMGTLSGNILLGSGAPAAGATLTITGPQTTLVTSDSNGVFSTIGLTAGTYTLDAAYTGLTDVKATVTVSVDVNGTVNLQFAQDAGNGGDLGSTSGFTPIRVRAGGGAVTDANGNVWSADTGFIGGYPYSDSNPIPNTPTPALYQAQRYNVGAPLEYRFVVPNGSYSVTLKFAETYFTKTGQRVANIVINGQTVQQNFDIIAAAGGANLAVDETYAVSVTNGVIDIQLTSVIQNPQINAIQIAGSGSGAGSGNGPGGSGFTPIRVRAGGGAIIDASGNVWSGDSGFIGGNTYSDNSVVGNTNTPALYQAQRYSVGAPLEYRFAVPNGSYFITLKFAETYFSNAGQRIANILINGQTVQQNFDIVVAAGGPNLAIDETYPVSVTNGVIDIQLTPVAQNPEINAIQITPGA
jgi:thermitase